MIAVMFAVMNSALIGARVYDARQAEITREGNHLFSQHKVAFSGSADEIRGYLDESLGPYAMYRELDDTGLVRAVESTSLDDLRLPVHEGRQLRRTDNHIALVGSQVPIRNDGTKDVYSFDGEDYEVIGLLGRQARSLVENDVIIVDRDLIEAPERNSELIVDGPAIEEQALALPSERVSRSDSSVNRRAKVDLVSPIIGTVVHVVIVVCAMFTGMLAATFSRRRIYVAHLLGRSTTEQLAISLASVLAVGTGAVVLSFVIGRQRFAELPAMVEPSSVLPVAVAAVTMLISLTLDLVRVKSWR
ncbi:hypothetical protein [Brevibacterium spongiae]|uniref:ABC transporter permease n=1 Tax=Brevibacterium spongiae TaxID=2909672 RepID=A0ABY5SSX1_9MICO|nr:hypothetical protein [Brevibacterium spongiae]UVI36258.1 hypothetical protein L1F31_00920 [Brevibacterium spongiae]